MVHHLHPVFILGGLSQAFKHFYENGYVVALCNSIPVGVNLQPPCKSIGDQGLREDNLLAVPDF